MGKRFKQQLCPCWKKTPTDSDGEDATTDRPDAPDANEEYGAKAKKKPQELSDNDLLLKRISNTEFKLTQAIEDMYNKLSDHEKANMDALKKYLTKCVENRPMEANTPTRPPSVQDGEGMVGASIEPSRPVVDGGHVTGISGAQDTSKRKPSVEQKDVGTFVDLVHGGQALDAATDTNTAVSGKSQDVVCSQKSLYCETISSTLIGCRYDVQARIAATDNNAAVSGESKDGNCSQKSSYDGTMSSTFIGCRYDVQALVAATDTKTVVSGESQDVSCSQISPSHGSITSISGTCSTKSPSEGSFTSLYTGPDTSCEGDNIQKELINGSLQANKGTQNSLAIETDTTDINDDIAGNCDHGVVSNSLSVKEAGLGRRQRARALFPRRSLSDFDIYMNKTLAELGKHCTDAGGEEKSYQVAYSPTNHPKCQNTDRNTNSCNCMHVPAKEPIQMCERETPANGFLQNHECKSELNKQEPASPDTIYITNTEQSSKRKLTRLGISSTDLWSNQAGIETQITKQAKHETQSADNDKEEAINEVGCVGLVEIAVRDSGTLDYVPVDMSSEEADNAENEDEDFCVPDILEQELGNTGEVRDEVAADSVTDRYENAVNKIQQLKMLCLKLFFNGEPCYLRNGGFGHRSQKYSILALTYINSAYQNTRNRRYNHSERNTSVQALKYLCRQMFGIQGLATLKESNNNLNNVVEVDTECQVNLEDLHFDASSQIIDNNNSGQSDTNSEYVKKEMAGKFGTIVVPVKVKAPSEEKWEEWTEPTTADLLQFNYKTPGFGYTPRTPVKTPAIVSLREIMDRYNNSGLITEFHGQFLCVNVLKALKVLHSNRIVHSAVIPAKVVFSMYGYPTLIPNIVAPESEPQLEYTTPEQITGDPITMATDIFQTGLLVYSFMYGKSPYQGNTPSETKTNLLNDVFCPEFPDNTISKDGRYFIRKCLRKDPDARFKLVKCRKSLDKAVKWFSIFDADELANQTSPSPFTDIVLDNQIRSQTKGGTSQTSLMDQGKTDDQLFV